MFTASAAGHEEGEAWFPLVVDCRVCETTHALAIGERCGCPFEGSHRASLVPTRHELIPSSDVKAGRRTA